MQDQISETEIAQANTVKELGNKFFLDGHYQKAIEQYSLAISMLPPKCPTLAIYFSNKAKCEIMLESYRIAADDAQLAIECDPNYSKGYYRLATALFAMNRLQDSINALDKIYTSLGIRNNEEVNAMLKSLRAMKRERDFFDSFGYDTQPEKVDETELVVESSYTGPVIPDDGSISLESVKKLAEYLQNQKRVHKKYVWSLIRQVKEILTREKNVVEVEISGDVEQVTVCGDIHGQYYDLLNIFSMNGFPTANRPYVFNGDFVDRGSFSVEVIILLMALKLSNPRSIFLNRGNHENADLNKLYGFEGEVKAKYCSKTFAHFTGLFNSLPLATLISKKVLVLHGGLFDQEGFKLEDINTINRHVAIPHAGPMCDLLWADPADSPGKTPNMRGVSIQFGPDITTKFLDDNKLGQLIRLTGQVPSGQGRRLRKTPRQPGHHRLLGPSLLR